MFKHLKLRTQLGSGFAAMIVLLVIVAATAYWGLSDAFDGFSEYRRLARNANKVGEFQELMLTVRLAVKNFIINESEQAVQDYRTHVDQMIAAHTIMLESIKRPERMKIVATVGEQITQYDQAFKQLVVLNQRQHEALERLNTVGFAMRQTATQIVEAAAKSSDAANAILASQIQEQVLLGRFYMMKYSKTHDRKDFQRSMEEEQNKVEALIKALGDSTKDTAIRGLLVELAKAHGNYIALMPTVFESIENSDRLIQGTLDQIGPAVAKATEELRLSYPILNFRT